MKKNKIYALYHGDDLILIGTLNELAERINVKPRTIFFYSTEAYKKRRKYNFDNCYVVIEVEDERDN